MSDLIDREEALKALKETYPTVWTESDYELGQKNQWSSDELAILTVPSAEPKKGRWTVQGEPPMYVIECSCCGQKYFNHVGQSLAKYCSNCGAKMEASE